MIKIENIEENKNRHNAWCKSCGRNIVHFDIGAKRIRFQNDAGTYEYLNFYLCEKCRKELLISLANTVQ